MAKKNRNNGNDSADEVETQESEVSEETTDAENEAATADTATESADAVIEPVMNAVVKSEEEPTEGVHERLEDLELAIMSGPQNVVSSINRVTILTGSLKSSLPEAIQHVADASLKADMEKLLGLL